MHEVSSLCRCVSPCSYRNLLRMLLKLMKLWGVMGSRATNVTSSVPVQVYLMPPH